MRFKQLFVETFNTSYKYKSVPSTIGYKFAFDTKNGKYTVFIKNGGYSEYGLTFEDSEENMNVTGVNKEDPSETAKYYPP